MVVVELTVRAWNAEAVLRKLTCDATPLAVSVVVSVMLLLFAAVIPSTVILPPLVNVRPVAVICCSSLPARFSPPATTVAPRPMGRPAVAVMLVAPELFNAPVPVNTMSAAVMLMGWAPNVEVVATVTPFATVRVPVPSLFLSALSVRGP